MDQLTLLHGGWVLDAEELLNPQQLPAFWKSDLVLFDNVFQPCLKTEFCWLLEIVNAANEKPNVNKHIKARTTIYYIMFTLRNNTTCKRFAINFCYDMTLKLFKQMHLLLINFRALQVE